MQRRQFLSTVIAGLSAAVVSGSALAQAALGGSLPAAGSAGGAAIAGQTYATLNTPLPAAGSKIEVLEFFSYGCPHCHDFSEPFERWSRKQAKDVVVHRVPVTFGRPQWVVLGRLFYAIQIMKLPALDQAVHHPQAEQHGAGEDQDQRRDQRLRDAAGNFVSGDVEQQAVARRVERQLVAEQRVGGVERDDVGTGQRVGHGVG